MASSVSASRNSPAKARTSIEESRSRLGVDATDLHLIHWPNPRVGKYGEAWQALTGLPLPLGGNAIRRGLGEKVIAEVSDLCRESIAWALEHREEVMAGLLAEEAREDVSMDRALLDRYLTMYANEDTRTMLPDVKQAIGEIFARRYAAGKIAAPVPVAFAP